jgi:hypothetical protein
VKKWGEMIRKILDNINMFCSVTSQRGQLNLILGRKKINLNFEHKYGTNSNVTHLP